MKKSLLALLTLAALNLAYAADKPAKQSAPAAAKDTSGMTEDQKTFYAVGLMLGQQLKALSPSGDEVKIIQKAISDSLSGAKPAVELEAYGPRIQPLVMARRAAQSSKNDAAGKAFAAKAAKEAGAVKSDSGLVYVPLKEGTGEHPALADTVKVNYRGTFIDGKEFDSSYKHGQPAEFPLNGVIKCWGEGVQKMKVGGKARLVCPAAIAYGDNSPPAIPPGSTLNFEIELLSVTKAAPAPAASAPAAPAK